MLRQLLALIALLTGIAAASAPAEARLAAGNASRVELAVPGVAAARCLSEVQAEAPATLAVARQGAATALTLIRSAGVCATVHIGIDRARE